MSISIDSERAYLSDDVVHAPPVLHEGAFGIPQGPGLGVSPDFAHIERFKADRILGAYLDEARPGWFSTKPSY